jgi:hypothetical protein
LPRRIQDPKAKSVSLQFKSDRPEFKNLKATDELAQNFTYLGSKLVANEQTVLDFDDANHVISLKLVLRVVHRLVIHLTIALTHVMLLGAWRCILLLPSGLSVVVHGLRALSRVPVPEVVRLLAASLVHRRLALGLAAELILRVWRVKVVLVHLVLLHLHLVKHIDVVRGLI